ncbi:MAG: COX15/CtaA family protein, partial [Pirellulaceae bacterium]
VLLLALFSFRATRHRGWVIGLSWLSLVNVLVNAVMGAIVVRSGLQPGIITLHMALAFLLIGLLVTIIWLTRANISPVTMPSDSRKKLLIVSLVFFACLFAEGLLGSQVREQTDELGLVAAELSREQWSEEIGTTLIFKIHRSFSWTLLITGALLWFWARQSVLAVAREPKLIFALVVAMMIMGVILGHIGVIQVVQVLHVGSTAILLAVTWHWIMRLWSNAVQ